MFFRIWYPANIPTKQDLLKCLHHFAANYYSNKGQLTDTSRIARQKKRAKIVTGTGTRSGSLSTANSISSEESDGSGVDIAPTSPTIPQNPEQRQDLVKDMYKIFDGSALVALGKHSSKPSARS